MNVIDRTLTGFLLGAILFNTMGAAVLEAFFAGIVVSAFYSAAGTINEYVRLNDQ